MKKYLILAALAFGLYRHTHSSHLERTQTAKPGDMQTLTLLNVDAISSSPYRERRLSSHRQSITSYQQRRESVVSMESIPEIIETQDRLDEKIHDTQVYIAEDLENIATQTCELRSRVAKNEGDIQELKGSVSKIEQLLANLVLKKE